VGPGQRGARTHWISAPAIGCSPFVQRLWVGPCLNPNHSSLRSTGACNVHLRATKKPHSRLPYFMQFLLGNRSAVCKQFARRLPRQQPRPSSAPYHLFHLVFHSLQNCTNFPPSPFVDPPFSLLLYYPAITTTQLAAVSIYERYALCLNVS